MVVNTTLVIQILVTYCFSLSLTHSQTPTRSLLKLIAKGSKEDAPRVREMGTAWGRHFLDCGAAGMKGFEAKNVTPYAHFVSCHAWKWLALLGALWLLSGQSLEKLNDIYKRVYLGKTNCRDLKRSLLTMKRREVAVRNETLRTLAKKSNKVLRLRERKRERKRERERERERERQTDRQTDRGTGRRTEMDIQRTELQV